MTDAQFVAWLKDHSAIRCVLVEVNVKTGGVETTRFLSNKGYVTSPTDTPANTRYSPYIAGGVKFTETLSLDGTASLSFGDIEIDNLSGDRDAWLDDVWDNRAIKVFIGDVRWDRTDFRQIFDGVVAGIQTKNRTRINLRVSDKLQRLNGPVSETKLGGATSNADRLLPLCFGECHNIEPLLVDPSVNEYQVHDGAIEQIIEVRDNGVPVAFTPYLTTGKFRLSAQPSGQITASVQGATYQSNLLGDNGTLTTTLRWGQTRIDVIPADVAAPDGSMTAWKIIEDSDPATNTHILNSSNYTASASTTYTWSVYVKAAERTVVRLRGQTNLGFLTDVVRDLTTGERVVGNTVSTATDVGNGWWRISVTATTPVGTTTAGWAVWLYNEAQTTSYVGVPGSGMYVWKPQLEVGSIATVQGYSSATGTYSTYNNTVATIARLLATKYGTSSRFTDSETEADGLTKFDLACPQPVGIYFKDRTNVIEALNKLADSVGGRVLINRSGKLSLIKLSLPQATPGTSVQPKDIVQHSLAVSQMPKVQGAVKLGYCKNWTVQQSNIAAGVPINHADLYKQEWLTQTRTDSVALADYKTFAEPEMEETLLLASSDAIAETLRRLGMWSVQRKVFKYVGMPWLMLEELGASQTLTSTRFGLEAGKTGQIISLATDWLDPHITVEILI